jgi:raffinose/stachyose/melibiose transport system substrate-binding protein
VYRATSIETIQCSAYEILIERYLIMVSLINRKAITALAGLTVAAFALSGCASGDTNTEVATGDDQGSSPDPIELSILVDNTENSINTVEALGEAFTALNPNISINVERRG